MPKLNNNSSNNKLNMSRVVVLRTRRSIKFTNNDTTEVNGTCFTMKGNSEICESTRKSNLITISDEVQELSASVDSICLVLIILSYSQSWISKLFTCRATKINEK